MNNAVVMWLDGSEVVNQLGAIWVCQHAEPVKLILADFVDLFPYHPLYNFLTIWSGQRTLIVIVCPCVVLWHISIGLSRIELKEILIDYYRFIKSQ